MEFLSEHETRVAGTLFPGLLERFETLAGGRTLFAHYTSAETTNAILDKQRFWLRNSTEMNDFSEIRYGMELVTNFLNTQDGGHLLTLCEAAHPGITSELGELITNWEFDWANETYIASVSEHDADDYHRGRLSMWRAYGNTAIVINHESLKHSDPSLGIFTSPVFYEDQDQFNCRMRKVSANLENDPSFLGEITAEAAQGIIYWMFLALVITTKHPAFEEEREWRIFYRPSENNSGAIEKSVEVIGGTPQIIYKIPLAHMPDKGLHHADLPTILDRIIIGPMDGAEVYYSALIHRLSQLNVPQPDKKVFFCDVPLRVGR